MLGSTTRKVNIRTANYASKKRKKYKQENVGSFIDKEYLAESMLVWITLEVSITRGSRKQGAHCKKENKSTPDYTIAGNTAYTPTCNPRGRKSMGHTNKEYMPKKPDIRCRRRGEFT